ncbi:DNA/RNA polymerases superfamily protein [Gossypium australe]|uniref:DNA/RNA polymerases superfamily protein n=1 Tax=Gossypium australe TaxID=47621 RepID=A0A5B6V8S7_9ROSI|nr:DNA/RNA polymerases superfamily protein [Gossypium australe]
MDLIIVCYSEAEPVYQRIQSLYRKFCMKLIIICQQAKAKHQVLIPSGLLQLVTVLEQKWDKVTMNFKSGLPLYLKKKDTTWYIVCQFPLFLIEIYGSHPDSGISYKKLWVRSYILELQFILRWMVNLNVYASMLCFRIRWQLKKKYLQLTKFTYNNSFQSSIKMILYEALYDNECKTP